MFHPVINPLPRTRRGRAREVLLALAVGVASVIASALPAAAPVAAAPVSGPTPWAILLCKFQDHPEEPQPPAFFRNFFTQQGAGTGGLFDYWKDMSYGQIDLTGSTVFGWFTMPYTRAEEARVVTDAAMTAGSATLSSVSANFHSSDVGKIVTVVGAGLPSGTTLVAVQDTHTASLSKPAATSVSSAKAGLDKGRWQYIQDCVATAKSQGASLTGFYQVAAMVNAQLDSGNAGGPLILDPYAWDVTFAAHEMGHGYGLGHSYSITGGEYGDQWDIMSAMNVWDYQGRYGRPDAFPYLDAGPGLNAPNRDALGWIPANRHAAFGVPCCTGESGVIKLAALTHPEAPGALILTIPLEAPNHYYTIELRHKDGWDQAIPKDTVLIHEIRPDGHTYLVDTNGNAEFWYAGGPQWQAGDTFRDPAQSLRVSVLSIDSKSATATVDVGWGFMGLPNLNPGGGGGGNDAGSRPPACGLGSVTPPVGGKTCAPIALQ